MTRPEPDPVEDREPSEEESDGEDTDNHEPGMDDCKDYEVQCKLAAREFLMNVRGMDEDEARRFIRENVEWLVCSASWEDAGEARGADVMVTFKFGKAPVDASLDYHHRIRWSEVEHMCKFTWNGTGNGNTTILQKTKFMLKATHVKAAREHCLPEGWPAAEAMEFIYRCCGVGGWNAPCQAADTNNGLTSDTEKLCKALDKKKAPAKKTGATGGVAKSKAAGKAAAGKAKQAV